MKNNLFIAKSPRLGKRKIIINGSANREIMREHLKLAYLSKAESQGCIIHPHKKIKDDDSEPKSEEIQGEYTARYCTMENMDNPDYGTTERIKVRKSYIWERIIY